MADMITAADWPLSTPIALDAEEKKATHPKTPYQPHNNYKNDYYRKRLFAIIVGLALAFVSVCLSLALYICVGSHERVYGWVFLTWFVVSAGSTAMLALLAPLFYRKYLASKGVEDVGGENGTPLKALGRKGIGQADSPASPLPVYRIKNDQLRPSSPCTPLRPAEMKHFTISRSSFDRTHPSFPFDLVKVRGCMTGQDCSPPHLKANKGAEPISTTHVLTPVSPADKHASPLRSSPVDTPPPRFPSPARLRAQDSSSVTVLLANSDDPFASDESPSSKASSKAESDRVARSDSLNKLRRATLRRKQAFERL